MTTTVEYMTTQEVAKYLGKHFRTVSRWRREKMGPPFVKIGGLYQYPKVDVERYLMEGEGA